MKVSQNQNNDNDMKAAFLCRPTILGTPSKKKNRKIWGFCPKFVDPLPSPPNWDKKI